MRILLALLISSSVTAQVVSFGVKAGAVLNDATSPQSLYTSTSDARLIGGPTIEFHLPYRLSIEADVLFRAYTQTSEFPVSTVGTIGAGVGTSGAGVYSSQTHIKAQEFPLLLKYRFLDGPIRPFVTAGVDVARQADRSQSLFTCLSASNGCTSNFYSYKSTSYQAGPAGGVGLDIKAGRFHIEPEVRYARRSNPTTNEVTALVGFTFGR